MKKLLLLSLLSMISASAYASNLYVGGQLGVSIIETKQNTDFPFLQHNLGGFGFVGGGFVGYKFEFCRKYNIGAEGFIFGNTAENKIRNRENDTRFTVSSNYNWGFRVLPGYQLLEQVEVHMIAGYTRGNFCVKDNGLLGYISRSVDCNGFQVGGGLTVDMGCHIALRFDGVFNGYYSERRTGVSLIDLPNNYRIKPYGFDGSASIIYNF